MLAFLQIGWNYWNRLSCNAVIFSFLRRYLSCCINFWTNIIHFSHTSGGGHVQKIGCLLRFGKIILLLEYFLITLHGDKTFFWNYIIQESISNVQRYSAMPFSKDKFWSLISLGIILTEIFHPRKDKLKMMSHFWETLGSHCLRITYYVMKK